MKIEDKKKKKEIGIRRIGWTNGHPSIMKTCKAYKSIFFYTRYNDEKKRPINSFYICPKNQIL